MAHASDIYDDYDGSLSDRELLEVALLANNNDVTRKERFRSLFTNQGYGSGAEADRVFDLFETHGVIDTAGAADADENPTPDVGKTGSKGSSSANNGGNGLDVEGPDPDELRAALDGPEFTALDIDWRPARKSDTERWGTGGEVPIAQNPPEFGYTGTTIAMPVADFRRLQEYIGVDLNPFGPDEGAPTRETFWEPGRGVIQDRVDEMAAELEDPASDIEDRVPFPWVEFGSDGSLKDTQEGRNRTVAAEEAGLDDIPVRVVFNDEHEGSRGPKFGSDGESPGGSGGEPNGSDPPSPSDGESGDSGEASRKDVSAPDPDSIMADIEAELGEIDDAAERGASASASSPAGGREESVPDDGVDVPSLAQKNPLSHPGVYIITGHRGSGKTMLAYRAAEIIAEREMVLPCTVGLPPEIHDEFPDDWHHVQSISEAPHEAVLVVDEAYDQFHAREAWDEENIGMAGMVNQSRHTGRTIFFITQSTSHLDKTAATEADGLLMKKPGLLHQNFERQQLRSLLGEAEQAFDELPEEDVNPQEFCFMVTNSFRGMARNALPEFHSVRLSRAYGQGAG